jgi:hypothetical protein
MLAFDSWLIGVKEKVVAFIIGWLGVSQKQIEICNFIIWLAIAYLLASRSSFLDRLAVFVLVCLVWRDITWPKAVQEAYAKTMIALIIRYVNLILAVVITGIDVVLLLANSHHGIMPLLLDYYFIGLAVHNYLIATTDDGEKLGKAKMAWSKLKELFGNIEWLPQPHSEHA